MLRSVVSCGVSLRVVYVVFSVLAIWRGVLCCKSRSIANGGCHAIVAHVYIYIYMYTCRLLHAMRRSLPRPRLPHGRVLLQAVSWSGPCPGHRPCLARGGGRGRAGTQALR